MTKGSLASDLGGGLGSKVFMLGTKICRCYGFQLLILSSTPDPALPVHHWPVNSQWSQVHHQMLAMTHRSTHYTGAPASILHKLPFQSPSLGTDVLASQKCLTAPTVQCPGFQQSLLVGTPYDVTPATPISRPSLPQLLPHCCRLNTYNNKMYRERKKEVEKMQRNKLIVDCNSLLSFHERSSGPKHF